MPRNAWSEMTPEAKARDIAGHKRRKFLRETGRPSLVSAAPAIEKVRTLYTVYAMSTRDIATACGVAQSTVSDLLRGHRSPDKGCAPIVKHPRATRDRLLAFEPDPVFYNRNARVDKTATVRRLQALCALGYGAMQISQILGQASHNRIWSLMRDKGRAHDGSAAFVEVCTRDEVSDLYAKYVDTDPMHVGASVLSVSRAKGRARAHDYAPPMCWDDDTIGDPAAVPEWTGECGTPEGYRIHIRETLAGAHLPLCAACKAAVETGGQTRETGFKFKADRFAEAVKEKGLNPRSLARKMGRSEAYADKLYRWRDGSRAPQGAADVRALAAALDVDDSELMDEVVAESGSAHAAIGRGGFNPYVMRAMVEQAELSHSQIAKILDVSHTSAGNWIRGLSAPRSPTVIAPLADHLGVHVDVFYS